MGNQSIQSSKGFSVSVRDKGKDFFVDPDEKSKEIMKRYQSTIDELEACCTSRSVSLMELKDEVKEIAKKGEFSGEISKKLRKQFFQQKEMEDFREKVKTLKEVRVIYEEPINESKGYEKYDTVMELIQDPALSVILEDLLKEELFEATSSKLKPVTLDEQLFTFEERDEWVSKELKRLKKKLKKKKEKKEEEEEEKEEKE